jgi:hypothetical protein
MGTIALPGVSYDEDVNFRCDASAAKAKCVRPGCKSGPFAFLSQHSPI